MGDIIVIKGNQHPRMQQARATDGACRLALAEIVPQS